MKLPLLVVLGVVAVIYPGVAVGSSSTVHPCPSLKQLTASFVSKRRTEEENKYDVTLGITKPVDSEVQIKFNSEASISLEPSLNRVAKVTEADDKFNVKFVKEAVSLKFRVSGPNKYIVPYITGFIENGVEYCNNPSTGYFDNLIYGNQNTGNDDLCGRRKINQTELTKDGVDSKLGYWPWQVIVNRLERKVYENVCGGTLLSNSWVLTAAHCVIYGETFLKPYSFLITLDYYGSIRYSVVGWIFDGQDDSSAKLPHYASLPMVSEAMCINHISMYYTNIVDDKKFCAGLQNDTENWYGDSGGGFYVFVSDDNSNEYDEGSSGVWYVRGILSQSPPTDPKSSDTQPYAVFTDISKYYQWIQKYI